MLHAKASTTAHSITRCVTSKLPDLCLCCKVLQRTFNRAFRSELAGHLLLIEHFTQPQYLRLTSPACVQVPEEQLRCCIVSASASVGLLCGNWDAVQSTSQLEQGGRQPERYKPQCWQQLCAPLLSALEHCHSPGLCAHSYQTVAAVTTEKAAEVRAELGEHRPVSSTYHAEQQSAPAAPSTIPQELPADSRAQSLHLCGFDISGVSIAGQVIPTCQSKLSVCTALNWCPCMPPAAVSSSMQVHPTCAMHVLTR